MTHKFVMTHNLPIRKYPTYIDAFKQYVDEQKKELMRARNIEEPYKVVRDSLARLEFSADTSMRMTRDGFAIGVTLGPTQSISIFDDLCGVVQAALQTVCPAVGKGSLHRSGTDWLIVFRRWTPAFNECPFVVDVDLVFDMMYPPQGATLNKTTEQRSITTIELVW